MHDLEAFANRLKKLVKPKRVWAERMRTDAYRLYEMDIPELRYIVDRYGNHAVVYDKHGRDAVTAPEVDVVKAVAAALALPESHIHLKHRKKIVREDGSRDQYERLSDAGVKLVVTEETSKYLVNLTDYLDTGLFLDHRPMRSKMRKLPAGTRLLNLFAYTGSVSIAAAQAGAKTLTVDMSNTYLEWAGENFALNGMDAGETGDHRLLRDDVLQFLKAGPGDERFDIVFLDPPTFSNSKKMKSSFDVQRDHRQLITGAMRFVAPGGTLYFSTNRQKFHLDDPLTRLPGVTDISGETVPEDFRDRAIHRCYRFQKTPT